MDEETKLSRLFSESSLKLCSRLPSTLEYAALELVPNVGPPYVLRWDSSFFLLDANQNGVVDLWDIYPIAENFGKSIWNIGCEWYTRPERRADLNSDYKVDMNDVFKLAEEWGSKITRFKILVGAELGPSLLVGEPIYVGYYESTGFTKDGFREWRVELPYDLSSQAAYFASLYAYDNEGNEVLAGSRTLFIPWDLPFKVRDLQVEPGSERPNIILTWTNSFFRGDGDDSGNVDIHDMIVLASHYSKSVTEDFSIARFDYDENGRVSVGDIGVVYNYFFRQCDYFVIEVSSTSSTEGFGPAGWIGYGDVSGYNEFGYRVYRYLLNTWQTEGPIWVRVTPYGPEEAGIPSEPVQID